jgi:hypothetical protein
MRVAGGEIDRKYFALFIFEELVYFIHIQLVLCTTVAVA